MVRRLDEEPEIRGDILVVDDNVENVRLLTSVLTEKGHTVRGVLNGKAALKAAGAAVPDLVLLDIDMPGLDGYAVCERLKQNPATADVPVVFISATEELSGLVKAFSVGGIDYISKPIQVEEVLVRVNNHLSLQRALRDVQAAEERSRRFEFIANTIGDMLSMVDQQYRYEAVNNAWCQEVQRPRASVLGKSVSEAWGDEVFVQTIQPYLDRCLNGETVSSQNWIELPGKGLRFCESTYYPYVEPEGGTTHGIIVTHDLTEQKRSEDAILQARDAAEQANKSKSAFLANMSHEIRTPLNVILGFSQLLQRDGSQFTKDQKEHLHTINRSGEHLLDLINDILEMSKIEAGHTKFSPHPFDLHNLLDDLGMMFAARASEKRLQFEVNKIGNIPRGVCTDEAKLRQILLNLLSNAVKFTNKGGITMRVTVRGEQAETVRLTVEVQDTGPGISVEDGDKIFEYFEQATIGSESQGGTGLGLAISREFVRLLGGEISFSSQVNVGTTFRFEIPLTLDSGATLFVEHPIQTRQVVGLQSGQGERRVLIADDNEDNRSLLSKLLTSVGFATREAADGKQLLQIFEAWRPHLIIADIVMPEIDGLEATRRIRSMPDGDKVVIIALTARAFEEDRKIVLAAGTDDFMKIPFRDNDLLGVIGTHLDVSYDYAAEDGAGDVEGALEKSEIAAQAISTLPAHLVKEMHEATINGYMDRLGALIDQVNGHDTALAEELRRLASRYEYDALTNLLSEREAEA